MGASEPRGEAVASYLIGKGVRKDHVTVTGATWARYPPNTKESQEGRKRRVQLCLPMPEKCWEKDRPRVCETYSKTGAFEVFE
jgi:hypothetical protein